MRAKKIVSLFMVVAGVFSLFLSGCTAKQKIEEIPPCDIPMQTVRQNSKSDLVTFEYLLPNTWTSIPNQYFSTLNFDPEIYDTITTETDEDTLPYALIIDNYEHPGSSMSFVTEETQQVYKDLFTGNTKSYKEKLEKDMQYINEFIFYKHNYEQVSNSSSSHDFIPKAQYITDYSVHYYNGTNGKIAIVKYTYDYNGNLYHTVDCIREDISYIVRGAYNDNLLISPGDIALWVADSLKVTENFRIQDGIIEKISI